MYDDWQILVDIPQPSPGLGFDQQARALRRIIENSTPRYAIGIFGRWGTGKTTLMHAVRDGLSPASTVAVEFSAWRYEREEQLLIPLLDEIREALVTWAHQAAAQGPTLGDAEPALATELGRTAHTVSRALTALVAGVSVKVGLPKAFELSFSAKEALSSFRTGAAPPDAAPPVTAKALSEPDLPQSIYHAAFSALSRAFRELYQAHPDVRIVVFVDDLDRCLPERMVEVLEAMKLFFDLEGFVFVVGVDPDALQSAVELRYAPREFASADSKPAALLSGTEYLKKIFQVPFSLPAIRADRLDELLTSFLTPDMPQLQQDEIRADVARHLSYRFPDAMINPREAKRFVNEFTIQRMVSPNLDRHALLALAALRNRPGWTSAYETLLADTVDFHAHLRELVQGNAPVAPPQYPDIGAELFEYLQGIARPLLDIPEAQVGEYISSAEAVGSPDSGGSTATAEIMPIAFQLQRAANEARQAVDASNDPRAQDQLRTAVDAASRLASHEALQSLGRHHGTGDLITDLQAFASTYEKVQPGAAAAAAAEAENLGNRARDFIKAVRRRG